MIITNNTTNTAAHPKLSEQISKKNISKNTQNKDSITKSNIEEITNKVLNSIKTTNDLKALDQAKLAKIAPNLAKDLQKLATILKNHPTLNKFAGKIEEFLKPNTADMQNKINSSGIFLEAKIAQIAQNNFLSKEIKELISFMKNTTPNLKKELLTLAKNDGSDTKTDLNKLTELLKTQREKNTQILKSSEIKNLINLKNKLENGIRYLDKAFFNAPKLTKKALQRTANAINAHILNIKNTLRTKQNEENVKELNLIFNKIKQLLSQPLSPRLISTNLNSSNLQTQLILAAKKLSIIITDIDKNALLAKENLTQIKHLDILAKKANENLEAKPQIQSLQNDIKATLLELKEATGNQPNLNQNINRLLIQIEMHQIISYAQNSVQTYLPFVWNELDDASVSFKQGKKNKFYAKIDLNFTKYGLVSVALGLYDSKFINISITTQQDNFKDIILKKNKQLKSAITKLGLIISSFTLSHTPKKYKNDEVLGVGLNLKA